MNELQPTTSSENSFNARKCSDFVESGQATTLGLVNRSKKAVSARLKSALIYGLSWPVQNP
jgi:hypothetical protein